MAKAGYCIFIGVGEDGLSEEDEEKLPEVIRLIYNFEFVALRGEGVVEEVEFQRLDFGRYEDADGGQFAGFGAIVYREWHDSSTCPVDIFSICQKAEMLLKKVAEIFQSWGLSAKPLLLNFCGYD